MLSSGNSLPVSEASATSLAKGQKIVLDANSNLAILNERYLSSAKAIGKDFDTHALNTLFGILDKVMDGNSAT